jgi:hypothetical protein
MLMRDQSEPYPFGLEMDGLLDAFVPNPCIQQDHVVLFVCDHQAVSGGPGRYHI